jgi:hypothetical protein
MTGDPAKDGAGASGIISPFAGIDELASFDCSLRERSG